MAELADAQDLKSRQTSEKPCDSEGSAAPGAAVETDLDRIAAACAGLPPAIREAILTLVKAAGG
jgi:hypothetical protein